MPRPWAEVVQDPKYQAMSPADQAGAKDAYFQQVVSQDPKYQAMDAADQAGARQAFMAYNPQPVHGTADLTKDGIIPQAAGYVGRAALESIPGSDVAENLLAGRSAIAPGAEGSAQVAGDIGGAAGLVATGGVPAALKALGLGAVLNGLGVPRALNAVGNEAEKISDKLTGLNLPSKVLGVPGLGDVADAASRVPGVVANTAANVLPYFLGARGADAEVPAPKGETDLAAQSLRQAGGTVTPAFATKGIGSDAGRILENLATRDVVVGGPQKNLDRVNAIATGDILNRAAPLEQTQEAGQGLMKALQDYHAAENARYGEAVKAATSLPMPKDLGAQAAKRVLGLLQSPDLGIPMKDGIPDLSALHVGMGLQAPDVLAASRAAAELAKVPGLEGLIRARGNLTDSTLRRLAGSDDRVQLMLGGKIRDALNSTINDAILGKLGGAAPQPTMGDIENIVRNAQNGLRGNKLPETTPGAAPVLPEAGALAVRPEGLPSTEVQPGIDRQAVLDQWLKANQEHSQTADILAHTDPILKAIQGTTKEIAPGEERGGGVESLKGLMDYLFKPGTEAAPVERLKRFMTPEQWKGVQDAAIRHLIDQSSTNGMVDTGKFSQNFHQNLSPLMELLDPKAKEALRNVDEVMKRARLTRVPTTESAKGRVEQVREDVARHQNPTIYDLFRLGMHPGRQLGADAAIRAGYYTAAPVVLNALSALRQMGLLPGDLLRASPQQRALAAGAVRAAQGNLVNQAKNR